MMLLVLNKGNYIMLTYVYALYGSIGRLAFNTTT